MKQALNTVAAAAIALVAACSDATVVAAPHDDAVSDPPLPAGPVAQFLRRDGSVISAPAFDPSAASAEAVRSRVEAFRAFARTSGTFARSAYAARAAAFLANYDARVERPMLGLMPDAAIVTKQAAIIGGRSVTKYHLRGNVVARVAGPIGNPGMSASIDGEICKDFYEPGEPVPLNCDYDPTWDPEPFIAELTAGMDELQYLEADMIAVESLPDGPDCHALYIKYVEKYMEFVGSASLAIVLARDKNKKLAMGFGAAAWTFWWDAIEAYMAWQECRRGPR